MDIGKLQILSPISSISFDQEGDLIFYSMGSCLCVENFEKKKKIFEKILIDGGKIYGIKIYDNLLYVFGQRIFKIYQFSFKDDMFELKEQLTFESKFWILDAKKIELDKIVLGYSNNSVEIFELKDFKFKSLKYLKGTLNCLLYSMTIFGDSLNDLKVASGTIFHDILIWNIEKILIKQLKGHEGVIFCVEFSDDNNWLISGSDDRTIKLWNLKDPNKLPITLYGHSARVWNCKFLKENQIVSCSEDALVKIWNFKGECIKTFQGHTGKNVWNVCVHPNQKIIASGGSDSSIKLWKMNQSKMKKFDLKNIKGIDILNENIKFITKEGIIYQFNEKENQILFDFGESKNFSVISSNPWNEKIIIIGDVFGNIYLVDLELNRMIIEEKITKSRILKVFWSEQNNQIFCFVTSVDGNLYQFIFKDNSLTKIDFINTGKKTITTLCCNDSNLLIGDSKGFIKLYEFSEDKMCSKPLISMKTHPNVNISHINFNQNFFYSVGWDGRICVYFIEKKKLIFLHCYKLNSIIKCLERIFFTKNHDLILYGYSGTKLIIYNFTQKYRVNFNILLKFSRLNLLILG